MPDSRDKRRPSLFKILVGVGWLAILVGVCGHVWHKWLREDAPGAAWMGEDTYVREHAVWWGLVAVGAICNEPRPRMRQTRHLRIARLFEKWCGIVLKGAHQQKPSFFTSTF